MEKIERQFVMLIKAQGDTPEAIANELQHGEQAAPGRTVLWGQRRRHVRLCLCVPGKSARPISLFPGADRSGVSSRPRRCIGPGIRERFACGIFLRLFTFWFRLLLYGALRCWWALHFAGGTQTGMESFASAAFRRAATVTLTATVPRTAARRLSPFVDPPIPTGFRNGSRPTMATSRTG